MSGDKPASIVPHRRAPDFAALRDSDVVALFMLRSRSPVSPRLSWRKTRGFLQFAEKFLHCMCNKVVWISCQRSGMSNPYLGVFLRFAERFSHLTLDVGVRLQADRPPKECQKAYSPPINVSMPPIWHDSEKDKITC